jgi:hypothetical protein
MVKLTIKRRHLGIFVLLAVIAWIGFAFAQPGTVPNPGHGIVDLEMCSAGKILKMNSLGTAWVCGDDDGTGGPGGPVTCSDLNLNCNDDTSGDRYIDSRIKIGSGLNTWCEGTRTVTVDGIEESINCDRAAPGGPGGVDTRCDVIGRCSQVCIGSNCRTSWPGAGGDNLGNHQATTYLNMLNSRVINVGAPISSNDAATKSYVDSVAGAGGGWSDSGSTVSLSNNDDNVRIGPNSIGVNKFRVSGGTVRIDDRLSAQSFFVNEKAGFGTTPASDSTLFSDGGNLYKAIYGKSGQTGGVAIQGQQTSSNGKGVYGWATGTGGIGVMASGPVGGWDFYAAGSGGNYGPFTGGHDVVLDETGDEIEIGMIVSSTGYVLKRSGSISSTLPEIKLSGEPNDKAVLGVFMSETSRPEWVNLEDRRYGIVNALGEGVMWVSNINGELENGDLVTTSEILGYGQKQGDDLFHSYTVAKLTENVDWRNIDDFVFYNGKKYKRALVGVTYHSG